MSIEANLAARRKSRVRQDASGRRRVKRMRSNNGYAAYAKSADASDGVLKTISGLKKSLLKVEQEAKLAEEELEDLRYVAPSNSLQAAFESVPRIMGAQEALQDALSHVRAAAERVDAAKQELRGAQGRNPLVQQVAERQSSHGKSFPRLRRSFYKDF